MPSHPEIVVRPDDHPKIHAYEVAVKYAKDVLKGDIIAGKLVKLAAKRFILDLKEGKKRGLRFDIGAAQQAVDFFGFCKHYKGELGGKVIKLEPWQVFILANIFGFKVKGEDGVERRRFSEVYIEVARKNGKSTFIAGIGLYMLLCDNEPGAEVYTAATTKEQAKIVFDAACAMRKASPFLKSRITAYRNNLSVLSDMSKMEPLSSDDNTKDGLNVSCGILDELHAHPDRGMFKQLREAMKSRRQPMLLSITTAGSNREGICWERRDMVERILTGVASFELGEHIFGYIACLDDPEEWQDEKMWIKANPNLGVSVKVHQLRETCNEAKVKPTVRNEFLQKHCNIWTTSDVVWMPMDKWRACSHFATGAKTPMELRLEALLRLKGRACVAGLDLSSKNDLTALVLLFADMLPEEIEEKNANGQPVCDPATGKVKTKIVLPTGDEMYIRLFPFFFMPADNVQTRVEQDRVDYDVWVREGWIETTPGNGVDYAYIKKKIEWAMEEFFVTKIAYDPWNSHQLNTELKNMGVPMEECRQGFRTISDPMKDLLNHATAGKIEHYGNPVLTWMVNNTQCEQDPAGNIKPSKGKSKEKIDGTVGSIMSIWAFNQAPEAIRPSIYEKRGILFI
jgi:phage terminase large subunit-like protein